MGGVLLVSALLLLAGSPARAQDCSDWGVISPAADPNNLFLNETYNFFVKERPQCGDTATCQWGLDAANAVGSLLDEEGPAVTYLAPATLEDCLPVSFRMFLECENAPVDSLNLTVRCTQTDRDRLLNAPGSTVAGGGCTAPRDDAALLLPLLLLWPRRRRGTHRA